MTLPNNTQREPPARPEKVVQVLIPPKNNAQSETPSPSITSSTSSSEGDKQADYMAFWLLQNISDCDKFSGKSIDYPDFLLNYEQSTQRLKSDPDMCLRILVSLLEGRALKLVKPFLRNRRRAEALREALETLRLTYGTDRKQSRAQLDLLLGRPKVQATEAGLIDFYSELNSCWMVMQDCNRTKDLDAEHTLKSLFNKLPDYLQNKWDKEVDKSPDQMPTYKLLMKVVLEEHRRKRGDLNQWREETRGKKRDGGRGIVGHRR